MPSITDWLMVIITLIYVIATICIMLANRKSAQISNQQLEESKKQFNESRRLQVLPYLQIHISDAIVDDAHKDGPIVQLNLENEKNDGNPSEHHFSCFISSGENIIESVRKKTTDNQPLFLGVVLTNNGEGIAHHIDLTIDYKNQQFGIPGEYMIPAHGGTLEGNIALFSTLLNKTELEIINEKRPDCLPIDIGIITLTIQYQDVLGNSYEQSIRSALMRYEDNIRLSTDDYFISAPQLIEEKPQR